MSNAPIIELQDNSLAALQAVDPSLKFASGSYGSDVTFEFESELLSRMYPEFFYSGFNMTHISKQDGKFVMGQYFMMGQDYSEHPDLVPCFVTAEGPFEGRNGVKFEKKVLGVAVRNISEAKKRGGILSVDEICQMAKDTFLHMEPDARNIELDYDAKRSEIWERRRAHMKADYERFGYAFTPAPSNPEKEFLEDHIESGSRHPVFSHLFSDTPPGSFFTMMLGKKIEYPRGYVGTILLTVPQIGNLSDLDVTGNFHKFYAALRQVLIARGLPDPLALD